MRQPSPTRPLLVVLLAGTLASCFGADPFGPPTTTVPSFETVGFVFTAQASTPDPGGRTLDYTVRVVNQGNVEAEVQILGGTCMLRARLYSNSRGTLEWSAFQEGQACGQSLETIRLVPGAERVFTGSATVDVDSGTYLATVTIEHVGILDSSSLVELSAGLVTFR